jgi:hypothetical protein
MNLKGENAKLQAPKPKYAPNSNNQNSKQSVMSFRDKRKPFASLRFLWEFGH